MLGRPHCLYYPLQQDCTPLRQTHTMSNDTNTNDEYKIILVEKDKFLADYCNGDYGFHVHAVCPCPESIPDTEEPPFFQAELCVGGIKFRISDWQSQKGYIWLHATDPEQLPAFPPGSQQSVSLRVNGLDIGAGVQEVTVQ